MALNKLSVKNAALLLVGAKKLTAATDASKAGRLTEAMFEISQLEIFDLPIDWQFAMTRATLTAYATDPVVGKFSYQFVLPAGCRRVVAQVDEDDDDTQYEFERGVYVDTSSSKDKEYDVIFSNQATSYIKYIRNRDNVAVWPAYFTKLVYINLAILLCEPLKQDKRKKNQLLVMLEEAYKKAEEGNAMESVEVSDSNVRIDAGNTDVLDAGLRDVAYTEDPIVIRSAD